MKDLESDPRKAASLEEAAKNPDGTFDGARALSWLSEALNPGRGVPVEDVDDLWKEAVERRRRNGH